MIWSEKELANMVVVGEKVAVSRVMPFLEEAQNADIFEKKNFSLLWGVLGVCGVNGASENACQKIWQTLLDNGAVDAYDKGILDSFNKRLSANCHDERFRAWNGLDNYHKQLFFENRILLPIAKANDNLAQETMMYCADWPDLADNLANEPLSPRLKAYLEFIRPLDELWDSDRGSEITKVHDKETLLKHITQAIAYAKRNLTSEEKEYLYFYIREAIEGGFEAARIGFNDHVLAQLVTIREMNDMDEIDSTNLLGRYQDVIDFSRRFENKEGFYEETAARLIHFDKNQIAERVERCLKLVEKQERPRGVLFALELVNLGQVKSAMKILLALAGKGQATEMCSFMHRILPKSKGAESVVLDVLFKNLEQQKDFVEKNPLTKEYITQQYLQAVRSLIDEEWYKESVDALYRLVDENWVDSTAELVDKFIWMTNWLLMKDKDSCQKLLDVAPKLGLFVFKENDVVAVGRDRKSFKGIQQKLVQTLKSNVLEQLNKKNVLEQFNKNVLDQFNKNNVLEQFNKKAQSVKKSIHEEIEGVLQKTLKREKIGDEMPKVATEVKAEPETIAEVAVKENEAIKQPITTPKISEQPTEVPDNKAEEGVSAAVNEPVAEVKQDAVEIKQEAEADAKQEEIKGEDTIASLITEMVTDETASVVEAPVIEEDAEPIAEPVAEIAEQQEAVAESAGNEEVIEEVAGEADEQETVLPGAVSEIKEETQFENVSNNNNEIEYVFNPLEEYYRDPNAPEPVTTEIKDNDNKTEISAPAEDLEKALAEKSAIMRWEEEGAEDSGNEAGGKAVAGDETKTVAEGNKININKILSIDSKEIDKQIDKMKKITQSALEKANEVKQKASEANEKLKKSSSVARIRQLAGKIKFFKKKQS